jgi:hypothetical protein
VKAASPEDGCGTETEKDEAGRSVPAGPSAGCSRRKRRLLRGRHPPPGCCAPTDFTPAVALGAAMLAGGAIGALIAVNLDPALLHREFAHVRQVGTFDNGLGVSDDEQGARIFVVSGPKQTWEQACPAFRDYS